MFIRNLYAGLVATAVAVLVPVLALPVFANALGVERWGLISFTMTLQAVAGILEAGAGQAISRQAMLVHNGQAGPVSLRQFFLGAESYYLASAFLLAVGGAAALLFFPQAWLTVSAPAKDDATLALRCCAALVLFQLPGLLYKSLSIGTPSQAPMNLLIAAFVVVRYGGAAYVVHRQPAIAVYFAWTLAALLLETLARRWLVARHLGAAAPCSRLECARRFVPLLPQVALAIATVGVGAAVTQVDRLLLSGLLTTAEFGIYALAATVAYGMVQPVYPLMQAAFPRLVATQAAPRELGRLNRKLSMLILAAVCVCAVLFDAFGTAALERWLRRPELVEQVKAPLAALLLGSALNAFYNIGYNNLLAAGRFRKILWVNMAGGIAALAAIPPAVRQFGLSGGAAGWIAISLIGVLATFGDLRKRDERT